MKGRTRRLQPLLLPPRHMILLQRFLRRRCRHWLLQTGLTLICGPWRLLRRKILDPIKPRSGNAYGDVRLPTGRHSITQTRNPDTPANSALGECPAEWATSNSPSKYPAHSVFPHLPLGAILQSVWKRCGIPFSKITSVAADRITCAAHKRSVSSISTLEWFSAPRTRKR